MLNKNSVQNLLACVEIAQKTGQITPDAMVSVGIAYQNGKTLFEKMDDGDVLIVFSPKKKEMEPGESGEVSLKPAAKKPAKEDAK